MYPVRQYLGRAGVSEVEASRDLEFLPIPLRREYNKGVVPAPKPALPILLRTVGYLMETVTRRLEERMPLTVRVDLCSLDVRFRAQEGVTENVSAHGARIVLSKPWKLDDRLNLWSLPSHFRARARVVYCEPLDRDSFVIGVQLLASAGKWK